MSGPFLIGPRVQLRPFEDEDAPLLADWINDQELRSYMTLRFPKSVKNEREWIASLSSKEPRTDIALGIELKRGKRLIGTVGIHQIDWVHRRGGTGIFLYPASMRGKGYGPEAKNLMIDYAFGEIGLHSLWAIAFEDNEASMRALKSQGYRRNGVMRKSMLVKGRWVDAIYFDILREEWEKLPRRKK
jgi:RimJ/RimL family protein N-acetyltransferase